MSAAATAPLTVVTPVVSTVALFNTASGNYIGGNFLQVYSDANQALFSGTTAVAYSTTSGNSNRGNTATYAITNLFSVNVNTNYVGPSSTTPDSNAAVIFSGITATALSSINYTTFTTGVSAFAPSSMSARQSILVRTAGGYSRRFQLTSSPTTVFSL